VAALPPGQLLTVVFAITCFGDLLAIRKRVATDKECLMAEAVDQAQHEFWRAPMPASTPKSTSAAFASAERSDTCRCGTEFIVSSVYCHACGACRPDLNAASKLEIPGLAEVASLGERLGVGTPAAVAFLLGVLCIVGALAVSVFFSTRTLLDWQAIQLWRIEWLLGAVAAFLAGCLLKR